VVRETFSRENHCGGEKGGDGDARHFLKQPQRRGAMGLGLDLAQARPCDGGAGGPGRRLRAARADGMASTRQGPQSG
jgi:hypothetical protein